MKCKLCGKESLSFSVAFLFMYVHYGSHTHKTSNNYWLINKNVNRDHRA